MINKVQVDINDLTHRIIGCAMNVHNILENLFNS
jgi:hypothetical protein